MIEHLLKFFFLHEKNEIQIKLLPFTELDGQSITLKDQSATMLLASIHV